MTAVYLELPPEEIMQRTAILRRLREHLKAQRERFSAYLDVLEKQKDVIEKGSAESLICHVELEEKIMADIFSIQKAINPLEELYRNAHKSNGILDLKTALEALKTEAVSRSERNKNLLSRRMAELRDEIKGLRSNPYARPRAAFSDSRAPSLVDLQG